MLEDSIILSRHSQFLDMRKLTSCALLSDICTLRSTFEFFCQLGNGDYRKITEKIFVRHRVWSMQSYNYIKEELNSQEPY